MVEPNLSTSKNSNPVHDLAVRDFGRGTTVRFQQITAGTGVLRLVPDNPNRLSFTLVNNSASIVYIYPSPDVSATLGIPLSANGGSITMLFRNHGEAVSKGWFGVSTVAARLMTLIETIMQGG